jgi:hypothetical protein
MTEQNIVHELYIALDSCSSMNFAIIDAFLPVSGACEYGDVNAETGHSRHTSFHTHCTE